VLQDVQSGWWLTFCSNTGNSSVNEERAGEKEREKAIKERMGEEKEKKSTIEKIRNLPPPPVHIPFQGLYAPHMARVRYGAGRGGFSLARPRPYNGPGGLFWG